MHHFVTDFRYRMMVPKHGNTEDPPRPLSPEIEHELEAIFREMIRGADVADRLKVAIDATAKDARARQLRAEEMLIALKAIEARVGPGLTDDHPRAPGMRSALIRALIQAYYRHD